MPVFKNQTIRCEKCEDVLDASIGRVETLTCGCGQIQVNVLTNYITIVGEPEDYEILYTEEVPSTQTAHLEEIQPPCEELDRIWALLGKCVERVGELEWELRRLVKLTDDLRK
jgi:phage FluMu protein Com